MKAFVCSELSEDLSGTGVCEIPTPKVHPEEVLVRVHAASINFPDILLCQGKYQLKLEPPFIPGMDISGEVVEKGRNVHNFSEGDHVVGGSRFGGFAEFIAVNASSLRLKPENMSFAQAASYPAAYLTAYVALVRRANLKYGETLLVHGASGGVGFAAVDVGKLLGATVIATGGSDEKLAQVVQHGADIAFNVNDGFRERVIDYTEGRGADVIFDPVGGDVFDESVRCIAFDGRLLVIGFTSGRIATVPTNMPLIKGFSVVGVRAGEYGRKFPDRGIENQRQIWQWAESGKTKPHIFTELPLDKTRDGLYMLLERRVFGKVIVRPNL